MNMVDEAGSKKVIQKKTEKEEKGKIENKQ